MLLPVLVLSAAVAAGPRVSTLGVRVGAGSSHEFGDREYAGFASSRLMLGLDMSSVFDLDLSYGFSLREGRSGSHLMGGVGHVQVSPPLAVEFSLFGSPLGRRSTTDACFTIQGSQECFDETSESWGFISPGVGLVYTTDPERDVVWSFNPTAEMTWHQLHYLILSAPRAGQDRTLTIQELRLGMGAEMRLFARLGLSLRADTFFLVDAADPEDLPSTELRAPAQQPITPRLFELSPAISFDFNRMWSAQVSGGYGPYRDECLGHNRYAALRLNVRPGRLSLFGQGTYEVDASPRDEATIERCELPGALPDFESISFGLGATLSF
jgi:hypothetical protein